MQATYHCIHRILRPVGLREHPLTTLHLCRDTLFLEESNHILIVKGTQGAVQEASIAGDVLYDFRHVRCIRDVAAPFAGNHHLAAWFLHLFQDCNSHRAPLDLLCFCGFDGRHHTRRTGTYDYDILCITHFVRPAFSYSDKISSFVSVL